MSFICGDFRDIYIARSISAVYSNVLLSNILFKKKKILMKFWCKSVRNLGQPLFFKILRSNINYNIKNTCFPQNTTLNMVGLQSKGFIYYDVLPVNHKINSWRYCSKIAILKAKSDWTNESLRHCVSTWQYLVPNYDF